MFKLLWIFITAGPKAAHWVRSLVLRHKFGQDATNVSDPSESSAESFELEALKPWFSQSLLKSAKVVVTDEIPDLPLAEWGLDDLAASESAVMSADQTNGITFVDLFFVRPHRRDDASLYFHELVHVVQWHELGVGRFLMLYADGLIRHGYRESPLEQQAYDLQDEFDRWQRGDPSVEPRQLEQEIVEATRKLGKQLARRSLNHWAFWVVAKRL